MRFKKTIEANFIPGYCFLTGQFLIHFEQSKQKNHYKEVHADFLESIVSEPKLADFYYSNPSVILMLCYGLIVYPLGFWKKQAQIDYGLLEKQIVKDAHSLALTRVNYMQDLFEKIKIEDSSKKDIAFLVRSLRNAISHSHVELNSEKNKFTFWDIDPRTGKRHFEAVISLVNLSIFLTGVGKFFINSIRAM